MYGDHKNPTHHIYLDPPMTNATLTIENLLAQQAVSFTFVCPVCGLRGIPSVRRNACTDCANKGLGEPFVSIVVTEDEHTPNKPARMSLREFISWIVVFAVVITAGAIFLLGIAITH